MGAAGALRIENLLHEAETETGLDDWGDDRFRVPLRVLLTSIVAESDLHDRGVQRAREWIALRLVQRLRMIEDRKRRPEIGAQSIDRPIFLMGFPRAGTTYLHSLLDVGPETVAPLYWQLCLPSPPPNDPGIDHSRSVRQIQDMLGRQGWLSPEIARTHHHAADLPEEDYFAFEYSFVSTGFMGFFEVPTYLREVITGDFADAYRWHRRVLQALQVGVEGRRWMLKAPEHTMHVDSLLAEYPDALLVQHHRDPAKVMASVFSVLTACRANYVAGAKRLSEGEARQFMHMYAAGVEHAMRRREDPTLNVRFCDVHYLDLERDPLRCVRRVYDHAGLDFTPSSEAAVAGWVIDNRKGKHGKHQYLLADYGLSGDEVREAFSSYIKRFQVELEPAS